MRLIKNFGILNFLCMFLINSAFAAEMVSNLGEPDNADGYAVELYGDEAQGFTTDGFSYNLTSVSIEIVGVDDDSGNFTLSIFNDIGGYPGSILPNGLLSGSGNPSIGEHTYTSTGVISLSPNSTYWVVANINSGPGVYTPSFTDFTSQIGAWSILDNEAYLSSGDPAAGWDDDDGVMRMSISADLAGATPASIPTLSEWGMIIFSLLLGGVAIWYMRKQSHSGAML